MARATVPQCDICGRLENVVEIVPVSVVIGSSSWKSDLCTDDVAPLRAVAATLPAAVPPKKRRTFDRARVSSVEDIPRTAKKVAAKKTTPRKR